MILKRFHHLVFTLLCTCLYFTSAPAAEPVTPSEHVRAVIAEVLEVLDEETLARSTKWERVMEVLHRHFDFRRMSQSILARHWQSASPEEQHRFAQYFAEYLEAIYREHIETYAGQRIDYVDEQIRGHRAMVDIVFAGDDTTIPVTFRLRDNDGVWLAYDVVIDGVSLVENYREAFDAILASEGLDALIDDVQGRIDAHRARNARPDLLD